MKVRGLLKNLLFGAGWALVVLLLIISAQWGFGLWNRLQGELALAQEQLGRFQGWLAVEPKVASRRDEVLGSLARVRELDFSWVALQNLQEVAKAQGLILTELRPAHVTRRGSPPILRLDAKVEGRLAQVTGFLQQLPQALPGVHLDNLQLLPEAAATEGGRTTALEPEGEQIQGILRLLLPFPGLPAAPAAQAGLKAAAEA